MAPSTGAVSSPRLLFSCCFGTGQPANDLKVLNISLLQGVLHQNSSKTNLWMEGAEKSIQPGPPSERKEVRPAHLATGKEHPAKAASEQLCIWHSLMCFTLEFQAHLIVWELRNEWSPDSLSFVIGLFEANNRHSSSQPDKFKIPSCNSYVTLKLIHTRTFCH